MKNPVLVLALLFISAGVSHATPDRGYALKQGCIVCHLNQETGELNDKGMAYVLSGYRWPPPKDAERAIYPLSRTNKTLFGFVHFIGSFMWFGTILYVHLILRPAYAAKGLPKAELILGATTMTLTGLTGVIMVLSRVSGLHVLFDTKWGQLLSLKILLYTVMVSTAVFVVAYLKPRLQITRGKAVAPENGVYDPVTLADFDGKEGRPAYIAYKEKVYDVTRLLKWKGGAHFKHPAGEDLTSWMPNAPHGVEKLEGVAVVGSFDETKEQEKTQAQKIFYFLAYMNLALVFGALAVIAAWRWSS